MSGCDTCNGISLSESVEFHGPDQADVLSRAGHWMDAHQSSDWYVSTVGMRGWRGNWTLVLYLDPTRVPAPSAGT